LYGTLPLTLDCNSQYESEITKFPFSFNFPLAERFISCLKSLFNAAQSAESLQLYEKLKFLNAHIEFDSSLCVSPFIAAVCEAIAYDPLVSEIIISDFSIAPYLSVILKNCVSLRKIIFRGLMFADRTFLCIKELFECNKLDEFIFERCDFLAPNSQSFFELFSKCKAMIRTLCFSQSKFSKQSLD
jgi:hypothetical protein